MKPLAVLACLIMGALGYNMVTNAVSSEVLFIAKNDSNEEVEFEFDAEGYSLSQKVRMRVLPNGAESEWVDIRGEIIKAKIVGRNDMEIGEYLSQPVLLAVFGIRSYRVSYDGSKLSGSLAVIYEWKQTEICRALRRYGSDLCSG